MLGQEVRGRTLPPPFSPPSVRPCVPLGPLSAETPEGAPEERGRGLSLPPPFGVHSWALSGETSMSPTPTHPP